MDWDKYYGLHAKLSYGDFTFSGFLDSRTKGVPTASWGTIFDDPNYFTLDERQYLEAKYEKSLNKNFNVMARLYGDKYHYADDLPYTGLGNLEERNLEYWLGAEAQLNWVISEKSNLMFGAEGQDYLFDNFKQSYNGVQAFNQNFPFTIFSVYLQEEFHIFKNLTIVGGGRLVSYSKEGNSQYEVQDREATHFMPRGTLPYSPFKKGAFKLIYGDAFREPSIYERSYQSLGFQQIANPELQPEDIKSIEIAYEQRISVNAGQLSAGVYLYKNYIHDLINSVNLYGADTVSQFQNSAQNIISQGIEFEFGAKLNSGLKMYFNCNFQTTKFNGTGQEIPNSPESLFKAGVVFPVFKYIFVAPEIFTESGRITLAAAQPPDIVPSFTTSAYCIANINISTKALFNHLKFSFKIYNLFNTHYENPVGPEFAPMTTITQDGRNYVIRAIYEFN